MLAEVDHLLGGDAHGAGAVAAVEIPGDQARVRKHGPRVLAGQDVGRCRPILASLADVEVGAAGHLLEERNQPHPEGAGIHGVGVLEEVEHRVADHLLDLVAGPRGVHRRLAHERLGRVLVRDPLELLAIADLAALARARARHAEEAEGLLAHHGGVDARGSPRRARHAAAHEVVVAARVVLVARSRGLAGEETRAHPRARDLA